MERTFTAERIQPFTKMSRNPSLHRPKRGSNSEAGQLCGWQEPHAAARHLDRCGVLCKVAELVDRLLILRFRLGIRIGQAEGCLAEARDAVGHGDFASKRL